MKSNQIPYDEELSRKYNSDYRFDHPHQFMAYSTWLEEIGDIKGKKVLDLACGGGTSTRMLSDHGACVVGVDISEAMLRVALQKEKDNPAGNKYILADASVPELYSEEKFDMVVAAFMLHYANNLEMLKGFVKNIALNLNSGGRFVSINMSPVHPILLPGKDLSGSSKWLDEPFKDGTRLEVILWSGENKPILTLTDYHWSKETYEEVFKEAGLMNIQWTELRMHEEGKKLKNWKEIEKKNMLVIISATKV
jgi:ubiquinone/menaquinone biosynthesis C-methylase UbiE